MPLLAITLVYLCFPLALFFVGFLQWPYALLATSILLYPLFQLKKIKLTPEQFSFSSKQMIEIFLITVLATFWVLISGSGHFFFQNSDYDKHNAILNDLIYFHWPVIYALPFIKNVVYLVYYVAYYLPAALVGKITNFRLAEIFLLSWTILGLLLGLAWIFKFVKKTSLLILLLLIFFSGLDVAGDFFLKDHISTYWSEHIEWWSDLWQLSSVSTLLFWVPQHFIPGLVATSLIFYLQNKENDYSLSLFIAACVAFWSPFITIGLIPLVIPWSKNHLKKLMSLSNLLSGSFILGMAMLFYLTKFPEANQSFLFSGKEAITDLKKYAYFLFFEFFIWFIFLSYKKYQKIILSISLFIPLLGIYKLGKYNDLFMRASIPSLILLFILVIDAYFYDLNKKFKFLFWIIFIVGSITPLHEIARAYEVGFNQGTGSKMHTVYMNPDFAIQYLGRPHHFFFDRLARKNDEAILVPPALQLKLYENLIEMPHGP